MLFNSYSYEILYEQFHWIYLQGYIKLLLGTVNNRLKFEIEIVHDLLCHPIASVIYELLISNVTSYCLSCVEGGYVEEERSTKDSRQQAAVERAQ